MAATMHSEHSASVEVEIPQLSKKDQVEILKACNVQIHDLLNFESIFAHLVQANLLTWREQESLQSLNVSTRLTDDKKTTHVLKLLPKKGSDALQRFVSCLLETADGTGHAELADFIQKEVERVKTSSKESHTGNGSRRTLTTLMWVTLTALVITGLGVLLWFYYPVIHYQFNLQHSKSLPYPSENFVGRDLEMQEMLELVDFQRSDIRIINIIGSAGFGKSTLAIHLGHRLVKEGVVVHYVNMAELSDQSVDQVLAEKVLESAEIRSKKVTFDRLVKWARDRYWYNLLILDNCDDTLNQQKEMLQKAVDKVVRSSLRVKVIMTSREVTMFLEYFHSYNIYEISTKAACHLLKLKVPESIGLNETQQETIAKLTGNVPLALQIIGSLLELQPTLSPHMVIEELKKQPIPTLSPEQLPVSQQVNASISLSYKYLTDVLRKVGQFYGNFPGSFSVEAGYMVFFYFQHSDLDQSDTSSQRILLEHEQQKLFN